MKMRYTIRRVTPADFTALLAVEAEAFLGDGYSPYFLKMVPYLFPHTCFVAEVEGEVVGYSLGAVDGHDQTSGWILTVAIKPIYHNHGIGKALTLELMQSMEAMQIKTMLLTVEPNNPAREIYSRLGFVETKYEPQCYGEGKARYYMERRSGDEDSSSRTAQN